MAVFKEIAAFSAYAMFSGYKCITVSLVFPAWILGVGISF